MVRNIAILLLIGTTASGLLVVRHRDSEFRRHAVAVGASPVVLELYQSQGCSSCPPALQVLRDEADRPDVIALNFAVTYWDQLGWKDSFAQPAFTQRQWDYARANGRNIVGTPQLIINGRRFVTGGNRAEVDMAIESSRSGPGAPALKVDRGRIIVGAAPAAKPATVWLVSYDPRTINVPIRAGENDGRTLAHRNIVRKLEALGQWSGSSRSYPLPEGQPGLTRAVLVQLGMAGPIITARSLE
jgi:hypothetical protein